MKLPTPAELASFVAAIGIERYCAEHPIDTSVGFSGVFYKCGFRDERYFSRAIEVWAHWERGIAEASDNWADGLARGAEMMKLVPLAQCMRELSIMTERTARSLFEATFPEFTNSPMMDRSQVTPFWARARKVGIERRVVDAMREEQSRRTTERARKAANVKAEKQRKKFKQKT